MCHCGLQTETLLSHPDVVQLNLRLHLMMFVPSLILFTFVSVHKMMQFYFMYFFSVLLNMTIYHNSNTNPRERLSGAAEHRSL